MELDFHDAAGLQATDCFNVYATSSRCVGEDESLAERRPDYDFLQSQFFSSGVLVFIKPLC